MVNDRRSDPPFGATLIMAAPDASSVRRAGRPPHSAHAIN